MLAGGGGGGGAGRLVVPLLDDEDDDEDDELDPPPTRELPDEDAVTSVGLPITVFVGRALVTTTGFSFAHFRSASWWAFAAAASAAAFCAGLDGVAAGGLLGGGRGGDAGAGDGGSSERSAQHGEHEARPVSLTGAQQGSHGCGPLVGSWHAGSRCR